MLFLLEKSSFNGCEGKEYKRNLETLPRIIASMATTVNNHILSGVAKIVGRGNL